MFSEASSFNQPLDSWNVSNVTSMNFMFCEALRFNQPLNWHVSKNADMKDMFKDVPNHDFFPVFGYFEVV